MHSASDDLSQIKWPTLGDLWSAWIERHCRVPDRIERGKPFGEYGWQFWCTANIGRVRPNATFDPARPPLNQAFVYRRTQMIGPQKLGKGPWMAAQACLRAVGPSEFAGWAEAGERYACSDHGCTCGWSHPYNEGEPKGMRHPSPLIQIVATSEDQVANVWRPLVSMIALGPLKDLMLPRGEFIRIKGDSQNPDVDRIDKVTASARSRLGAPCSEVLADETGLFTKSNGLDEMFRAMRRNVAGMGGRTLETTNAFDPSENSSAQQAQEYQGDDIFRFWRDPDKVLTRSDGKPLSFRNAQDRRRILEYVYAGADHVNLDSVEAEAEDILAGNEAEAERFFGNRRARGAGSWLLPGMWESAYAVAG